MAAERRSFHNPREVDEPPYRIDPKVIKRYDQRLMIFNRVFRDPEYADYRRTEEEAGLRSIAEGRPGHTRVDYALSEAAWTVHESFANAFGRDRIPRPGGPSLIGEKWTEGRMPVEDAAEMSRIVKRAARLYGADLVGIARYNPLWMQSNTRDLKGPLEMPNGVDSVVVCAIEMNADALAESPDAVAGAATGVGYSKMAFVGATLSEFIRDLGYFAEAAGNDVGLSVPAAIDAGLGQLGRNGLLITPEYGPRVRLVKIYTDLPLSHDKPISFRAEWTCRYCKRCALACKAGVISFAEEPGWDPACPSSSPGAEKWYVDGEKCYRYWAQNGADCSDCVTNCPYSAAPIHVKPGDFWKQ